MPADHSHLGTVWIHKITKRLMRACIMEETVVLHNCEISMRDAGIPMCSWSGTFEEFTRAFRPASSAVYPPTAKSKIP